MEDRLRRIRESIPKKFFFHESFEKNGRAPHILADIPLSFEGVDHGNILNCSPLLNKEQELHLFIKLNYLRYRLIKLTVGFPKGLKGPKPCKGQNLENLKESGVRKLEDLVARIQETRNIILKANTRLIVKQANKNAQSEFEYEEMISNGCCHVMKAIDNFDFRKGFKFSTYCVNVLKSNLWRDRTNAFKIRAPLEFSESINTAPSRFEADLSESNVEYNRRMIEKIFGHIRSTMKKPEDKVEILRGLFGLDGRPLLLRELGEKIGLTKERIRQIKKGVIEAVGKSGIVYDPLV